MSAYDNVVTGKLKLKGKALDVKSGGVKKKKKQKKLEEQAAKATEQEAAEGESTEASADTKKEENAVDKSSDKSSGDTEQQQKHRDDRLTPAEKRYIEQKQKLDVRKLAKEANKSHRDRIQDFNQSLANMSEHYDIPKVGPG